MVAVEFDRAAILHVRRAKTASRQHIRFAATSCAPSGSYGAIPAAASAAPHSPMPLIA
jgi:hypothetical protein